MGSILEQTDGLILLRLIITCLLLMNDRFKGFSSGMLESDDRFIKTSPSTFVCRPHTELSIEPLLNAYRADSIHDMYNSATAQQTSCIYAFIQSFLRITE